MSVDVTENERNALVFKALSDATRLAVLEQLRDGEKCACVLLKELEVGQSGLSYHMKVLCDSGLVASRREGKWTHYRLDPDGADEAIELLRRLTTARVRKPVPVVEDYVD